MSDESEARSAETARQQFNVYAPTCLDIWLNEPRNAPESRAPANLLRLWFPESILGRDFDGCPARGLDFRMTGAGSDQAAVHLPTGLSS